MKAFLYMLIPVFAGTVYAYCIFLFISFAGSDVAMDYNYFAVLACAVLACLVNYRLSLREQTLVTVAVVNAALVVLTEIVGFSTQNEIEGVIVHAIAALVFLAPAVHCLMLYRYPIRANTMLLFCELSITGTAVFMLMELGYFEAPPRAIVLSIVCLALNLFLLSALRTDAPAARKTEVKKQVERGMILAAVVACAAFAAGAIVVFALPQVRGAISGAVQAIGHFFAFLGRSLMAFLAWLAEHLPAPDPAGADVMPAESLPAMEGGGEMEEMLEISDAAKIIMIAIFAAVVIGAVLFFIVKSRKTRLRRIRKPVLATREDVERGDGFAKRFLALLHRCFRRAILAHRLFVRRYTYEGFFVRLSRIAKRKGHARAPGETPADYLDRLTPLLEAPTGFFPEVAAQLDLLLYAPGAPRTPHLDKGLASRLLHAAKRIK
jgi:hypothetical protein